MAEIGLKQAVEPPARLNVYAQMPLDKSEGVVKGHIS
jgi:hypothetical protein